MSGHIQVAAESSGAESDSASEGGHRSDNASSGHDLQGQPLRKTPGSVQGRVDGAGGEYPPSHAECAEASPDIELTEKASMDEQTQESNEPEFSLYERFGWLASTVLIVTALLILGAVGFLWFLWTADHRNATWHSIAVRNWITRAVTLSSVVVRTSVSLQATAGTSMLAGLALENAQILILHLASVSMMRSANAGPYMLLWLMFKAFLKDRQRWRRCLLPLLILVLSIIQLLTEFTSTTLLSDLKQGTIPGHSSSSTTATNFVYDVNNHVPFLSRGTVWTKKPPVFPAFAEYHQGAADVPADAVDTGPTLRAFLPIQVQEDRSMLRNFSGKATVLDSRVRCVQPQLTLEKGHLTTGALALTGQVSIVPYQGTNFSCVLPELNSLADGQTPNQWQIGMTYLGQFPNASVAPIQSELRNSSSQVPYGMAFIVVNVTAGSVSEWQTLLGVDGGEFGSFGGTGAQPVYYRGRNEWADLLFTTNASLIMSTSLCYASYDSTVLSISASSGSNRTEPSGLYNVQKQSYDYSSVRRQLGQGLSGQQLSSLEDRKVLILAERGSWMPGEGDYANSSWLSDAVELTLNGDPVDTAEYATASSYSENVTAYLYDAVNPISAWPGEARISSDPSISALFQEILQNQGSIAFALQSILSVFTGMVYYDQLQLFNSPNEINTTPFISVNRPQSIRGIVAVTTVLAIHLLLMALILHRFLFKATLSTIGNAWQTLAQVMRGDALELARMAALTTDNAVEAKVKQERWKYRLVGMRRCRRTKGMKIVYRDSPSGLAKMMIKTSKRQKSTGQKSRARVFR